jgi:hypothetical protein
MANNYCENKSNKPVITKYDPSKNYVVQMVESLASIDYPNENHIYVIESTGDKYIYYNGAFSKFESASLTPFIVEYTANFTGSYNGICTIGIASNVTFSHTFEEISEALDKGLPIYLKDPDNMPLQDIDIQIEYNRVTFTWNKITRVGSDPTITMYDIRLPLTGVTGTGTYVSLPVRNLLPDNSLSDTSVRAVQNKAITQEINYIKALIDQTKMIQLDYDISDDITAPFPPTGSTTTQITTNVYQTIIQNPPYTFQYINANATLKPIRAFIDFGGGRKDTLQLASNFGGEGIVFSGFSTYNGAPYVTELIVLQNITRVMTYIMS